MTPILASFPSPSQNVLEFGPLTIHFYGIMIAGLLGIALLISQARRLGPRVVRGLLLLSCIILVIFAGLLITQGLFGR